MTDRQRAHRATRDDVKQGIFRSGYITAIIDLYDIVQFELDHDLIIGKLNQHLEAMK